MAMITVSTSPPLTCRTSWSSVSLAVFSAARRPEPFTCSDRVAAVRLRDAVTLRAIPNPSRLFETDEDVLHFGVELDRVHTQLAPNAAALVPAEGRLGVDAAAAVDAEDTRPNRFRQAQG